MSTLEILRPCSSERPEPPAPRSKYRPLYDFLRRRADDELVMTLPAVEIVLKGMLPNASCNPAWWSAPQGVHAGTLGWAAAGFTAELAPDGRHVRFVRRRSPIAPLSPFERGA